ncbi:MAG: dephospho-CoA kinase [Clostridiales bacterium]|nr:dephospho-CoA kinase [Clostridiales bacterium]
MGGTMRRIGITGGIGAGKSAVTDFLRERGYAVIDADEVSREAAMPGEPSMLRLREELGDGVFLEDGNLDRKALAELMFADSVALMTVNEIFHGDIKRRMAVACDKRAEQGDKVVFISAPLLFEAEADWMADEVWLVSTDEDVRLRRVMERDGLSEAEVLSRMENQMPEAEKRARADAVIENNGGLEELYAAVEGRIGGL